MRHARFFLLGLLLIAASLLGAQSAATNPQQGTATTAPVPSSEEQNRTSVPDARQADVPRTNVPQESVAQENVPQADVLQANQAATPKAAVHTRSASKPGLPPALAPVEDLPISEPQQPKTEILDTSATAGALATDGHDPILDPPPFPKGMTTLIGGVIASVDRIGNHLKVRIYGGGYWTIFFDERTHIFHGETEVTQLALKPGDRVYVDTMLDNNQRDVFARNIRIGLAAPPADTEGQIVEVDTRHSEITMRDSINSESVRFMVAANAKISEGSTPASFADLRPGSLVRVKFTPERPNRGEAREIVIVAKPGASFTFAGPVTFLDRHRGVLAVHNTLDNKTYDLHISAARMDTTANLAVGAEVRVVATFDAIQYTARQITVTRAAGSAAK